MKKLPRKLKRQSITLTLLPSTIQAVKERAQANALTVSKAAEHWLRLGMGLP